MVSKPSDWDEVDSEFISTSASTPRLTPEQLWGTNELPKSPTTYFNSVVPKVFVLVAGGREYAVRTEGFQYVRYIQRTK